VNVFKLALPALVVVGGLCLCQSRSFATPAYAKKEHTGCKTCHITPGKKELNHVGECYKSHEHKDLASCEAKK
jgi:hypothetical protein